MPKGVKNFVQGNRIDEFHTMRVCVFDVHATGGIHFCKLHC